MGDVVSTVADAFGMGPASIQAEAATDAARIGAGASAAATAAQERMFNKQLELQEPWRQSGQGALNRLNYLMGLDTAKTYDQYRAELLPQYTTRTSGSTGLRGGINTGILNELENQGVSIAYLAEQPDNLQRARLGGNTVKEIQSYASSQRNALPGRSLANDILGFVPSDNGGGGGQTIDEAALDAAIRARMSADAAAPKGSDYGKYARDFSMSDFEQDPGYAFRLSEGQKALDRQAAARGGLISGGALKAAERYGQDMGSQEYTNAFNRYQTNRSNQLQPLQSLAGVGQTAANTLSNAAGNYGTNMSNLAIQSGATQGAAALAGGNIRASQYGTAGSALNTLYNNRNLFGGGTSGFNAQPDASGATSDQWWL
jgi:hypothetical protein